MAQKPEARSQYSGQERAKTNASASNQNQNTLGVVSSRKLRKLGREADKRMRPGIFLIVLIQASNFLHEIVFPVFVCVFNAHPKQLSVVL